MIPVHEISSVFSRQILHFYVISARVESELFAFAEKVWQNYRLQQAHSPRCGRDAPWWPTASCPTPSPWGTLPVYLSCHALT